MNSLRIVFMGSPEFSLPSLEALIKNFSVVGVVTQPDRPAGRGKELTSPPVKRMANEFGIDLIQPARLGEQGVYEKLMQWNPDVIIVVAFGQILRKNVLNLPKFGCINIHGSILPRWRGAAPIQRSILNGDASTGITIMKMDEGVDTGPIITQERIEILPSDTSESLGKKLSVMGANLLVKVLPDYVSGKIGTFDQPSDGITYAPMINKEDGLLDFTKKAIELNQQIRAFYPWPGSFMIIGNERIKVVEAIPINCSELRIAERSILNGFPIVGTKKGCLRLELVQPAGKKPMKGNVFLNGFRNW